MKQTLVLLSLLSLQKFASAQTVEVEPVRSHKVHYSLEIQESFYSRNLCEGRIAGVATNPHRIRAELADGSGPLGYEVTFSVHTRALNPGRVEVSVVRSVYKDRVRVRSMSKLVQFTTGFNQEVIIPFEGTYGDRPFVTFILTKLKLKVTPELVRLRDPVLGSQGVRLIRTQTCGQAFLDDANEVFSRF